MENSSIFSLKETKVSRDSLDCIKKSDLKFMFEILMADPESRTIADLNTLLKILINVHHDIIQIEPIKMLNNFSLIYHACKSMFLAKFKPKSFVYQKKQEEESLYIILNGKIGLYKRSQESTQTEQVIFLSEGFCFGSIYNWKNKFLPLTFEETLIAIIPKRQMNKIIIKVSQQNEKITKILQNSSIFSQSLNPSLFRQGARMCTINRVPFGNYLIKEGEIPRALFYLIKGNVKKQLEVKSQRQNDEPNKEIHVLTYSSGDYFPKENLCECLPFNLITESPCEIISIPKKCLDLLKFQANLSQKQKQKEKLVKDVKYYCNEIQKQDNWKNYKNKILKEIVPKIYKQK